MKKDIFHVSIEITFTCPDCQRSELVNKDITRKVLRCGMEGIENDDIICSHCKASFNLQSFVGSRSLKAQ